MMGAPWDEALAADPARRDREAALVPAVAAAMAGREPDWVMVGNEEALRRLGYLVELGQLLRGQTEAEQRRLDVLRRNLPPRSAAVFWPGDAAAAGDHVAASWGFSRGCGLHRLRAALRRLPTVLPADTPPVRRGVSPRREEVSRRP